VVYVDALQHHLSLSTTGRTGGSTASSKARLRPTSTPPLSSAASCRAWIIRHLVAENSR